MDKKMSRGDFLKIGLSVSLGAIAITACGDILAMGEKKLEIGDIAVGEDNFVITKADLEENKYVNFTFKGKQCILLYNDGQIKAYENICTHKGGKTELQGKQLVCLWHGAIFDPLTGKALKGPAPLDSKLPEVVFREQDGKIYVCA